MVRYWTCVQRRPSWLIIQMTPEPITEGLKLHEKFQVNITSWVCQFIQLWDYEMICYPMTENQDKSYADFYYSFLVLYVYLCMTTKVPWWQGTVPGLLQWHLNWFFTILLPPTNYSPNSSQSDYQHNLYQSLSPSSDDSMLQFYIMITVYIPIQLFHNMYSPVFLIVICIIIF